MAYRKNWPDVVADPHEPAVRQVSPKRRRGGARDTNDGDRPPPVRVCQAPADQHADRSDRTGDLLEHGNVKGAVMTFLAQELGLELRRRRGKECKQHRAGTHEDQAAGR